MKYILFCLLISNGILTIGQNSVIIIESVGVQYVSIQKTFIYAGNIDSVKLKNEIEFPSDDIEFYSLNNENFQISDSIIQSHLTTIKSDPCDTYGSIKISKLDRYGQVVYTGSLCGKTISIDFLTNLISRFNEFIWAANIVDTLQYYIDMLNDNEYLDKK